MAEPSDAEPKIGTVASYGPAKVTGLKLGDIKQWCRCGLSKTQPWCDGSHKGTGMLPLNWEVDREQGVFYLCACKQTKTPPFCDGHHKDAPMEVMKRMENCARKSGHVGTDCKLCTGCGWVPDF